MTKRIWMAIPVATAVCFGMVPTNSAAQEKTPGSATVQIAMVALPAAGGSESSSAATNSSATSTAATSPSVAAPAGSNSGGSTSATAAPSSSSVSPLPSRSMVIKELVDMKARIAELESELKARTIRARLPYGMLRRIPKPPPRLPDRPQRRRQPLPRRLLKSRRKPPPSPHHFPVIGPGSTTAATTSTAQ